jgi:hypothetical protein
VTEDGEGDHVPLTMAAVRDIAQAGPDDDTLRIRAENRAARLTFPPSYVLVGVYRLFSDGSLFTPIWDKCRHGVRRGGIAALIWVRDVQTMLTLLEGHSRLP